MAHRRFDSIRRLFKPALVPGRSRRVFEKFDEGCGYREYHEACRARFARRSSAEVASGPLTRRGFEFCDSMDAGTATRLLKELEHRFASMSVKKDKPELVGYDIDDAEFRRALIEAALTPGIDDRIARYFGSEYRVHWFQVTRTEAEGGTASFLWHCDQGPKHHLKLIVYLNDSSEHDGNTEFLDLERSEALDRVGYVFGPTATRTDDLTELLAREDLEYKPESRLMAPGDAVLFEPSRVIHRGVSPTRGQRTALTLCLIPSEVPWSAAFEKGEMFDLRSDEKWHEDARVLLSERDATMGAS